MRDNGLRSLLQLAVVGVLLTLTIAIGVGTWLGYRWFTDTHLADVDDDGKVRAKVISATLYAKNELRVGQLTGVVQGVGHTSRLWGWLESSQVIKAPFSVDYFVDLRHLAGREIRMSNDGHHLLVSAPDVYTAPPNVDMARTSLNNVAGLFVTRSAYSELSGKVAASAQTEARERARSPDNMRKVREFARRDLSRFLEAALRAGRVDADVEVRFASDPLPSDDSRWNMSRSIEEVLNGAKSST